MGEKQGKKKTTVQLDYALWKRLRHACTEMFVDQQVAIEAGIAMWVVAAESGERPETTVKLPVIRGESTVYDLLVRSIEELRAEILALRTQMQGSPNDQTATTTADPAIIASGNKETTGEFVRRASQRIADADELTQRMQAHLDKPNANVPRDKSEGKGSKARSA